MQRVQTASAVRSGACPARAALLLLVALVAPSGAGVSPSRTSAAESSAVSLLATRRAHASEALVQHPQSVEGSGSVTITDVRIVASRAGGATVREASPPSSGGDESQVRVKVHTNVKFASGGSSATLTYSEDFPVSVKSEGDADKAMPNSSPMASSAAAEDYYQRLLRASDHKSRGRNAELKPSAAAENYYRRRLRASSHKSRGRSADDAAPMARPVREIVAPPVDDKLSQEFKDAVQQVQKNEPADSARLQVKSVTVAPSPTRGGRLRAHLKGLTDSLDAWEPPRKGVSRPGARRH